MNRWRWILALAGLLTASAAQAQPRPYIGYVYPAGGQQGTTFQVRAGGQGLDGVREATVSGRGVSAKVVEYRRRLNNQEIQLLREQLRELKGRATRPAAARGAASSSSAAGSETAMMAPDGAGATGAAQGGTAQDLASKIQTRVAETIQRPACASIANLVLIEVTVAPDAPPGPRELVVATHRGVSNPLVFYVGQLPEVNRKPMLTAEYQVLGKEELALRKRPDEEVEQRVALPCTLNGQIASGEVNRYRFDAHKGQRLVISAAARQLVPFIADAVPGWFQPVLVLSDANGKELAYNDDYRFKPDPTILFEVPKDGQYVLGITDAIYRGREDFVYRVTIGELPFVTGVFPMGGRAGSPVKIEANGWNLEGADLLRPSTDAGPGASSVAASREGLVSNRVPFALDTLPEGFEKEPNNDRAHAQKVKLPIVINGRVNRAEDWDVFQFEGREGDTVVAEVAARRLDSPLDSLLKITDADGKLLAVNDDHEDPEAGVNTHDADSYLTVKLPADGTYYVHLGDSAQNGGEEYAYRLRISPPRPDFALRIVPSSVSLRTRGNTPMNVQVIRKDGFSGSIKLGLKDPPAGFSSFPVSIPGSQSSGRLNVKTDAAETKQPVRLIVEGRAEIEGREVVRQAVPAEDRMQAFLWRHLVPARELKALVFDPSSDPAPKRIARARPSPSETKPAAPAVDPVTGKPKFTKQQVAGRLRQLKILLDDGLITERFYEKKVAECEAAL